MYEHGKQRRRCPICDPTGHLTDIVSSRTRQVLQENKELTSAEYLGCDITTLEAQFVEGMFWDNQGEWHIDYKIPITYWENGEEPSLKELVRRLHYTNTQ